MQVYRGYCPVYSVKLALCNVLYAVCSKYCAVCRVQCAVCSEQCVVCSEQCVLNIYQYGVGFQDAFKYNWQSKISYGKEKKYFLRFGEVFLNNELA